MTPNTTGAGMPYDIPPRAHPEHMSGYAEEIPMTASPNPSVVEAVARLQEYADGGDPAYVWQSGEFLGRPDDIKRDIRTVLAALNKDQADAG
jgi:hypothetical protein